MAYCGSSSEFTLEGFPHSPVEPPTERSITFACSCAQAKTEKTHCATFYAEEEGERLSRCCLAAASHPDIPVAAPLWVGRAASAVDGLSLAECFPRVVVRERLNDLRGRYFPDGIRAISAVLDSFRAISAMHIQGLAHNRIDASAIVRPASSAPNECWRLRDLGECISARTDNAEWRTAAARDVRALAALAHELFAGRTNLGGEASVERGRWRAFGRTPLAIASRHAHRTAAVALLLGSVPARAADKSNASALPERSVERVRGERALASLAAAAEDWVAWCERCVSFSEGTGDVRGEAAGARALQQLRHPLFLTVTRDRRTVWALVFGDGAAAAAAVVTDGIDSANGNTCARSLILDPAQLHLHSGSDARPEATLLDGRLGDDEVSVRLFNSSTDVSADEFRRAVLDAVAFEEAHAARCAAPSRGHMLRCFGACFDGDAVAASGERIGRCIVTTRHAVGLRDVDCSTLSSADHIRLVLGYARALLALCRPAMSSTAQAAAAAAAAAEGSGAEGGAAASLAPAHATLPSTPRASAASSGLLRSALKLRSIFEIVLDESEVGVVGIEIEVDDDECDGFALPVPEDGGGAGGAAGGAAEAVQEDDGPLFISVVCFPSSFCLLIRFSTLACFPSSVVCAKGGLSMHASGAASRASLQSTPPAPSHGCTRGG